MRDGKQTLKIESAELGEDAIILTLTDGHDRVEGRLWLTGREDKQGRTPAARTIEALVKIGFRGMSLEEVAGDALRGFEVWATVETHPDYGQRAKYIDPPRTAANFSHLDQMLRHAQQKAGNVQPPRQVPRPQQPRQAPPPVYRNDIGVDDSEVPF